MPHLPGPPTPPRASTNQPVCSPAASPATQTSASAARILQRFPLAHRSAASRVEKVGIGSRGDSCWAARSTRFVDVRLALDEILDAWIILSVMKDLPLPEGEGLGEGNRKRETPHQLPL